MRPWRVSIPSTPSQPIPQNITHTTGGTVNVIPSTWAVGISGQALMSGCSVNTGWAPPHIHQAWEDLFYCEICGTVCKITDKMQSVPEQVMTRISGQDGVDSFSKFCPNCKSFHVFKRVDK